MTFEEWWMSRPQDVRRMSGSGCVTTASIAWDAGARAERDACIRIMQSYKVLAGNSPAGEMAADWTLDALLEVADELKTRGKHDREADTDTV